MTLLDPAPYRADLAHQCDPPRMIVGQLRHGCKRFVGHVLAGVALDRTRLPRRARCQWRGSQRGGRLVGVAAVGARTNVEMLLKHATEGGFGVIAYLLGNVKQAARRVAE